MWLAVLLVDVRLANHDWVKSGRYVAEETGIAAGQPGGWRVFGVVDYQGKGTWLLGAGNEGKLGMGTSD